MSDGEKHVGPLDVSRLIENARHARRLDDNGTPDAYAIEIGQFGRGIGDNGNANVACVACARTKDQTTFHPLATAKDSLAAGYNLSITFLAFLGRSTPTFDEAIYMAPWLIGRATQR